ncbi:MAG TPA: ShlB/FhaC/HecB family hemolysin secretion/activation protein [Actinomycetes bacterium]
MTAALAITATPYGRAHAAEQPGAGAPAPKAPVRTLDINEFRVEGVTVLSGIQVEQALVPFIGPSRTLEDVEKARAALEKAYTDRGYQTVLVAIPAQTVREGVVSLKVMEGKVGRLRVNGAHWFSPFAIKQLAPSVQEGTVPNFDALVGDIVVLNQWPDRRVTPAVRPGSEPGTVDVDLNVQETFPLHGSVEVNNRYSVNTVHVRLNGAIRYDNLWQLGHSLGFSFQIAPANPSQALVFALNYLARFPGAPWFTLAVNGVIQESEVSTLGGTGVLGRGRMLGARAVWNLPGSTQFFHSLSFGLDWKLFFEDISFGGETSSVPIRYWPFTLQYASSWLRGSSQVVFNVATVMNIGGLSSPNSQFDNKRYKATANFIYLKGDLGYTQEIPGGLQLFLKASAQYSGRPLVAPEQYTSGGAESIRGYYEVNSAGDSGVSGTVELRSPTLSRWLGPTVTEWRFHLFTDAGKVWIHEPLPEQKVFATLWGAGAGTRIRMWDHLAAGLDVAIPLTQASPTVQYQWRIHFRVAGEF